MVDANWNPTNEIFRKISRSADDNLEMAGST